MVKNIRKFIADYSMFASGHCLLLYHQTEPKTEETAFTALLNGYFRGQIHKTDIQGPFSNKADLFSNLMWNLVGGVYKMVENNK